ncbi:hypothetical protein Scep_000880 [Stephania cephalantha]|uniref:Uncharacterized protein n=1 Tax=Stephania cephalantha TaxID=152367 RepID=A0AAP0LB09_9MAGN
MESLDLQQLQQRQHRPTAIKQSNGGDGLGCGEGIRGGLRRLQSPADGDGRPDGLVAVSIAATTDLGARRSSSRGESAWLAGDARARAAGATTSQGGGRCGRRLADEVTRRAVEDRQQLDGGDRRGSGGDRPTAAVGSGYAAATASAQQVNGAEQLHGDALSDRSLLDEGCDSMKFDARDSNEVGRPWYDDAASCDPSLLGVAATL